MILFTDIKSLETWIIENIDDSALSEGVTNAALWFMAMRMSLENDYSTKDMAWLYLEGIKPVDADTIEDYFDTKYHNEDEDYINDIVVKDLKSHFGINS